MSRRRPLPELAPGQCAAIVESTKGEDGAKLYSMQGFRLSGSKRCSRRSTTRVGHLDLCTVHARMAHEGLVSEVGDVAPKSVCADVRRYPKKFGGGVHSWVRDLPQEKK